MYWAIHSRPTMSTDVTDRVHRFTSHAALSRMQQHLTRRPAVRLALHNAWRLKHQHKRPRRHREWTDDVVEWCGANLQELSRLARDWNKWQRLWSRHRTSMGPRLTMIMMMMTFQTVHNDMISTENTRIHIGQSRECFHRTHNVVYLRFPQISHRPDCYKW